MMSNFKKDREDKVNLYLNTMWDETQGNTESTTFNIVISNRLDWAQSETDHISEYAAEIGYIEIILGGEVSFTDRGANRVKEMKHKAKIDGLVEIDDIVEEVEEVEGDVSVGLVSTVVNWVNGLFSK